MRLIASYHQASMTWPVVVSQEPVFNPDYGVRGIPTTVIIAPDGTVRHRATGFTAATLAGKIDELLREFHLRAPSEANDAH